MGYILCLDTCLYHVIHQSHVRLLLFVVSRWETAKLCPKTDLRNLWIVSYFVLFSVASDVHCFWPILSRSDVCPPRVSHIVFMFINRQLFISRDIQWHVTVFSVFFVKVKVEFVSLSANFDYLYLYELWMIHNKVVWDRHYSFNRFTVRNNFLLFFNRFTLRLHL